MKNNMCRANVKHAVKKVLPKPVIENVVRFKDWLDLVSAERREFNPVNLHPFEKLTLSAIFENGQIQEAWNIDHAEISSIYGNADTFAGVNPGDRRALYYLIMALRPENVLEVGTHIGASTLHIARALKRLGKDRELVTADILDVNDPQAGPWKALGLSKSPKDFVEDLGCGDVVSFEVGPCIEYMEKTSRKFDFIFLDGDHRAAAVYQELSKALDLLNDTGVILLHDFYPEGKSPYPDGSVITGPFKALERAKRENDLLEVLPLGDLPWPTKQGTNVTSLALVLKKSA